MQVSRTHRGFQLLEHDVHPPEAGKVGRLVQASSVIGNYADSLDHPGSSYLWIGDHHHLNREEVRQLLRHLANWLRSGSLEEGPGEAPVAGVWPDAKLEAEMLRDADLVAEHANDPSAALDLACHVRALLDRVRYLERELLAAKTKIAELDQQLEDANDRGWDKDK